MQFHEIINARLSHESDRPLMQKEVYPVREALQHYLLQHGRNLPLPLQYEDLLHYSHTNAIRDEAGRFTHWEEVLYDAPVLLKLTPRILQTYALLMGLDATSLGAECSVAQIDFCEFGNSVPFRILLQLHPNDYVQFYIKIADASRVYGLEIEQLLSPLDTHFLCDGNTLVEEHIGGQPGDLFLENFSGNDTAGKQLATEFVAFNERCFIRLLGDMRSYNFVANGTAGQVQLRAIDFDQQCYEGKKNLYFPQFYKENYPFVSVVEQYLDAAGILTIQQQERSRMTMQAVERIGRLQQLLMVMEGEELSENYKVLSLRSELGTHFRVPDFEGCATMGQVLRTQLRLCLKGLDI